MFSVSYTKTVGFTICLNLALFASLLALGDPNSAAKIIVLGIVGVLLIAAVSLADYVVRRLRRSVPRHQRKQK